MPISLCQADTTLRIAVAIACWSGSQADSSSGEYGAGVYGNFIAASLKDFSRIDSFIDQNPLLQGTEILNRRVRVPDAIPENVEIIYVGLNPKTAKAAIEKLDLDRKKFEFFYL